VIGLVDPKLCRTSPAGPRRALGVGVSAVAGRRTCDPDDDLADLCGGSSERYVTSYSFESCCPISWKIGWSSAGVAVSTYVPPVRFARLLSVSGSYCGELSRPR
jgi:hypothetical protein